MSDIDAVLAKVDADLDQSLDRLFALLRIQSVSTDPAFAEDCVPELDDHCPAGVDVDRYCVVSIDAVSCPASGLKRSNPILLLDFLRSSGDCPIVLLHCYPFEREAGYLAQAFSNVYLDTGLSINYLGTRAAAFIARTLELAPFRKLLFSTDAFGPPELHYLGAFLWRDGMASVLAGFVERGQWALDDARRVSTLIGRENAMRLYRL